MFTAQQRARMRAVQEDHMPDICVPLVWTEGRDPDGQETEGYYEPQDPTPCGFQPIGSREAGTLQVTSTDRVRLPYDEANVLSSHDRIRVTFVYGQDLATQWEFQVSGEPHVGPTGIVLELERVTT